MTFKRMLGVSASALAYLALSAGPAAADPVTTFIVTTIGLTGTAAAVASFVINTALWTGASHLVNKVFGPKNAGSGQARQADITSLSLGESPREMIVGRAVTGGSLVQGFNHGGQHGTDKETLVIAIADELCDGLEGVFVDDAFTAHTGDGDVAGTGGGLNIRWRNGAVGQTFPADLRALAGFDADDRLAGVAHVWVTYTAEWAQERGGRPRLRFRVRGGRRYDPRKDSTVPGGSGAHRWSNPATWEWTENLILNRYAYQRGVYCEGRVDEPDQLWVGRGLTEAEAPPERIIAWANLCDEAVALKGGGTEPRWRVGGVIRANETYIDVDEKFAAACGGTIIQPEGGIEVEPGHAKATVVHITDDDLIAGEPVQFNEFLPETERINTVVARYVDPSQDWQFHSAPVRRSTADVQADGGPYTSSPGLDLVTSGTQAQRVGEIIRRQGRLENRASFTLGPRFGWLERGDWISWTSARWLRGATKTFRITADPLDEGWRIRPQLEEVQAAVFGWTPATDEITPQTAPPDLWSKPGPLSLAAVGVEVIDRNGIPGLRFTWTTPVDPAITSVTCEVRVKGETQSTPSLTRDPNSGQLDLTDGVAPETLMEARAWPAGSPDRDIQPSPWVEIGAGILKAGDVIDDLRPEQYQWTSRRDYFSFSSAALAGPNFTTNATMTAAPAGTPVGDEVRLTRTGSGAYFQINNVNLPGSEIREIKVRMFAPVTPWTPANWDGRLRYATAGHSYSAAHEKDIPFPRALETVGKHVWAIWDMADLTAGGDDFLTSVITGLRFYFHATSADGLALDVTYFGLGRSLPNGVGARGVSDQADQTGINTAAFIQGQTPWATLGLATTRLSYLDDGGNLSSLSRISARDFNLLTSRTADHLAYLGGGGLSVESLRPGEAGANVTEGRTSAFVFGQTPWATLPLPTARLNYLDNSGNLSGLDRVLSRDLSLLTGRTANFLSYVGGGGLSVESLRPGEAGANVTEARTSAFVFGQGPLATQSRALASQVAIALGPNLVPDASLEDVGFWSGGYTLEVSPGAGVVSKNRLRRGAQETDANVYSLPWPVRPGARLRTFIGDQPSGSDNAGQYTYLQWFDQDAVYLFQEIIGETGAGLSGRRESTRFTQVPANATSVRLRFRRIGGGTSAWLWDSPKVEEVSVLGSNVLRETGALLTDSLAVTNLGTAAFVFGQTGWATLARNVAAIQYLNDTGRIVDGRGLPLNASFGQGATLSPVAPLGAGGTPSTEIAVAASTATFPGGYSLNLPAATISGLSAGTTYAVFRDLQTSTYLAVTSGIAALKTSADRYLFVGYQATELSGGGYLPPPPLPPGGGGGWNDRPDTIEP